MKAGIGFVLFYGALWLIVGVTNVFGIRLLGHCYVLDCASLYLLSPSLYVFLSSSLSWIDDTFATVLMLIAQTILCFLAGFAVGGLYKKVRGS